MSGFRAFFACVSLSVAIGVGAEPSAAIRTLMETPPSALDMFLFRVHESAKCGNWLGAGEPPDLCLASVQYAPATDVIDWHFQISSVHEDLMDFADLEEEQREFRLMARLERVVQLAGVEGRWGLLRSVPLSVAADAGIDTEAMREALAARSAVHLHVTYDSMVYTATRDVDGFTDLETMQRSTGGE